MQSLKYRSCIDQILIFYFLASNKECVKPSVCLATVKVVFSTALRLTINKVGGMHYFASGCFYTTLK